MSTITPHAAAHSAAQATHSTGRAHGHSAAGAAGPASGFASLMSLLAADASSDEALDSDALALAGGSVPPAAGGVDPGGDLAMAALGAAQPAPAIQVSPTEQGVLGAPAQGLGRVSHKKNSPLAQSQQAVAALESGANQQGLASGVGKAPAGLASTLVMQGQNSHENVPLAKAQKAVKALKSGANPMGFASGVGKAPAGLASTLAMQGQDSQKNYPLAQAQQAVAALESGAKGGVPLTTAPSSEGSPAVQNAAEARRVGGLAQPAGAAAHGGARVVASPDGAPSQGLRVTLAPAGDAPGASAALQADAQRQQAVDALLQNRTLARPGAALRDASAGARDLKSPWAQALSAPQVQPTEVSAAAATALSAAAWMEPVVKPQERGARQNPAGAGLEAAAGALPGTTARADGVFEVAQASAAVAPDAVAETVSAWVMQGLHSAELRIDGLGDDTIDVRISLAGDQAQVDFRSDVPELRQLIEAAMPQLKERLAEQGLQLSASTVGWQGAAAQSGQGGAGQSGAGAQAGSTPSEAGPTLPERVAATRPSRPGEPERALDLFV
ncbi:MAG: hypothetical protein Fur007_02770 [Rhodoferax sp.]